MGDVPVGKFKYIKNEAMILCSNHGFSHQMVALYSTETVLDFTKEKNPVLTVVQNIVGW